MKYVQYEHHYCQYIIHYTFSYLEYSIIIDWFIWFMSELCLEWFEYITFIVYSILWESQKINLHRPCICHLIVPLFSYTNWKFITKIVCSRCDTKEVPYQIILSSTSRKFCKILFPISVMFPVGDSRYSIII